MGYTLQQTNIAVEHGAFLAFPLLDRVKRVIFRSYICLPEGMDKRQLTNHRLVIPMDLPGLSFHSYLKSPWRTSIPLW